MRKALVTAAGSAIIFSCSFGVGFAGVNPFSDVPADHWSFDAVAKLAQEGVIEGYGDNTFRGGARITRYEMAQMVAKAMAKESSYGAHQDVIDKLAAEYAEELDNLGVRVARLEKNSSNLMIRGLVRLDGADKKIGLSGGGEKKIDRATAKLRLDMTAFVNDDWTANARFEALSDLDNGDAGIGSEAATAMQIYAGGPLLGGKAKLGKFGSLDNISLTTGGLLLDAPISGAEFTWGDAAFQTAVTVGRLENDDYYYARVLSRGTSDYGSIQLTYNVNDALKIAAGYHTLRNSDAFAWNSMLGRYTEDTNGIWTLAFDYKVNKDFTLGGYYAKTKLDAGNSGWDSGEENTCTAQLTYKGAKSNVANSYGAWLAYRQIGVLSSMYPTYNGVAPGEKGLEFGVNYMLDKNVMARLVYFDGEEITGGNDVKKYFGRMEFQF